jgi:hypothetical protein
VNRGSAVSVGDELFLIETIYPGYTRCKAFTSRAGFDAGLRAVRRDVNRAMYDARAGGAKGYRTFWIRKPQWKEFKP